MRWLRPWLAGSIILAATLMPAQQQAPASDRLLTIDGASADIGPVLVTLDSYLVDAQKAVAALTSGRGTFKKDSKTQASIVIDGKVAIRFPYESLDARGTPESKAQIFDPIGSDKPARAVPVNEIPRDEESPDGKVTSMINLEVLAALLGASVDFDGPKIEITTPHYWAEQLGLSKSSSDAVAINPLGLVPEIGISPPARVMQLWVRPYRQSFVQVFRLSDGIPRPMLGVNAVTGQAETVESGEIPRIRQSSPTAPVRVETEHFESRIGKFGRYAAIVTNKDLAGKNPIDAIEDGDIGPGDYAIVGIRQRVSANPVTFRAVPFDEKDTMASFALKAKNDVSLVLALNGLRQGEKPVVGTKLVVMDQAKPIAVATQYQPVGIHAVKASDTVEKLAMAWKVTPDQIYDANPGIVEGSPLTLGDILQRIGPANTPSPSGANLVVIGTGTLKQDQALLKSPEAGSPTVKSLDEFDVVSVLQEIDGGKYYQVSIGGNVGFLPGASMDLRKMQKVVAPDFTKVAPNSTAPIPAGTKIVQEAVKYLGTPYQWGGNNLTGGIDCSHFVAAVYNRVGVPCPPPPVAIQEQSPWVHYKEPGIEALQGPKTIKFPTKEVPLSALSPGDRVIIQRGLDGATGSRHTGIYAGVLTYRGKKFRNAVVHASRPGVRIDELTSGRLWSSYRYSVRGNKVSK